MKRFICLFALLAILSMINPVNAHASRQKFCKTWLTLCKQTSPGAQGQEICASRHGSCLSSGCFFFNNPGPRCESNAADKTQTQRVNSCLRNGQPVGFGRCT